MPHQNKTQTPPPSATPIRKLPQASYPYPSEGQNGNHNHRKVTKLIICIKAFLTQWNYELCHVGPPKSDRSWWRVLTKRGLLEKGMADHFSILTLRTPWTAWKGIKICCSSCGRRVRHGWTTELTAYLTFMQITSYEMLGRISHQLELRLPGEISTTSDVQMITF